MTVLLIAAVAAARASEIAFSRNASAKVVSTPPSIQPTPSSCAPSSARAPPM